MAVMTHAPLARAMVAAGRSEFADAFTYQDYLYELCAHGTDEKPVSEQQWEMICDIIGPKRRMLYASNIKTTLGLLELPK